MNWLKCSATRCSPRCLYLAAYASKIKPHTVKGNAFSYNLKARGGNLSVKALFNPEKKSFSEIYLTGPATLVFECDIEI